MDDVQAAQWKDELKEFVKVNDERGVEGTHSSKRIYKNVIYHLNQVPPLTTSNSSMSCTLKSLLFQTFTLTCRIDLAGLSLRFKCARTPLYLLLPFAHVQVADIGNSKKNEQLANTLEGVDLNIPLTYAD